MTRLLTYLFAGIVLGGIIHICVIIVMPTLSKHNAWTTIVNHTSPNQIKVLGEDSLALRAQLGLDPAFTYAVCQLDLNEGPVQISGNMSAYFWTTALVGQDGSVPYSTNSRTNNNQDLKIGVFTEDQARTQVVDDVEIDPSLQIIRVPFEQLTAIVRVLPPHRKLAPALEDQLQSLTCSRL